MNRRDMIIVAVLLNATIIAVLLMMAVNTDEESLYDQSTLASELLKEAPESPIEEQIEKNVSVRSTGAPIVIDLEAVGFDGMLGDFNSSADELFLPDEDLGLVIDRPSSTSTSATSSLDADSRKYAEVEMAGVKIVEIAVKKGDSLDKIARANGTTIEAIKRLNQLKSEKLSIGQQLRIPVGFKKSSSITTTSTNTVVEPTQTQAPSEAVYYTVKSGDNPWKIAKQLRVDMEDLLRLNNLNEEKARNLKVGDRIRVK
ncbi:MAG: LysM peptidoglycan-binding domain-containing protein [Parachlamydiaceae bacterium]|nr:LysM peptidoglycan-binding domain-containing protein [Parachlamydiaceae bacterium]